MVKSALAFVLVSLLAGAAAAQPADTELAAVTAELLELRQQDGVLRLAVRVVNTTAAPVSGGPLMFNERDAARCEDPHEALRDEG